MAISYPVSFPTTPSNAIRRVRWGKQDNTLVNSSTMSGVQQVVQRQGAAWVAEYELAPMKWTAGGAEWAAFLMSLEGAYGTFNAYKPDRRTPRGIGTGTPLVDGASQTGNSLVTDGWTASQTGIMKAGDFFTVGTPKRLYMVVADANSGGGAGAATLSIVPQLRESPANNAAITVSNWTIPMRLLDNLTGLDIDEALFQGLSFKAIEAL